MIPKSGNRFSEKIMRKRKNLMVTQKRPPGDFAAGGRASLIVIAGPLRSSETRQSITFH
jgi:hypothetical protein